MNINQIQTNFIDKISKYNNLHIIETANFQENLNNNFYDHIFENFDKMDEIELRKIVHKFLSYRDIKKIILESEFFNHRLSDNSSKIIDLNEFEKISLKIFNRYKLLFSEFFIEDSEWTLYKESTSKYTLQSNEILFENTIDLIDIDNEETLNFLDMLIFKFNSISSNIKTKYHIKKDKHAKIAYILVWIIDKNIEVSRIGL